MTLHLAPLYQTTLLGVCRDRGFKRLTSDAEPTGKTVAFSNPFFQKNHPELVLQITMVNHAKERKMAQKNQAMKKPAECKTSKKADPALPEAGGAAAAKSAVRSNKGPAKVLETTADLLPCPRGVPKELPSGRTLEVTPNAVDLSSLLGDHGPMLLSQRADLLRGTSVVDSNTLQFLSRGWPQRNSVLASIQGTLFRSTVHGESPMMPGRMSHSTMSQFLTERGQPNGGLIPIAGGGAGLGLGAQLGSSLLNRAGLELLQLRNRAIQTRNLAQSSTNNPFQPNKTD